MDRTTFIQNIVIRSLPTPGKEAACLNYAEGLWDFMTERGYGAPKQRGPNKNVNWYAKLAGYQKIWFDQFWTAFAHKHGKQDAAKVWHKLGDEINESTALDIRTAAKVEAAKPRRPEEVRIMAEGWLNKRRWEDAVTDTPSAKPKNTAERTELISAIRGLQVMLDQKYDEALAANLAQKKAALAALDN